MPSSFDVNIRTTGDTTGAEKVKQSLEEVKAEQESANAAAGAAPGSTVAIDRGSFDAQLEREAALRQQILGTETEISAKEAERNALQERLASLTTQRQILIDLELERVTALAAGETERAAAIESEINLQKLSLQIQTSAKLSQEEALAIASARLAKEAEITAAQEAQAGAGLLGGVNIGKARQEATTLARELATGSVNTRTIGSLAGSLGSLLGVAGIAAYSLYNGIAEAARKTDEVRINTEKESAALQQQTVKWRELAAGARTVTDVQRLQADFTKTISDLQEKLREVPSESGIVDNLKLIGNGLIDVSGKTKTFLNLLTGGQLGVYQQTLKDVAGEEGHFATSTDEATAALKDHIAQVERLQQTYGGAAQKQVEYFKSLDGTVTAAKQIATLKTELEAVEGAQRGVAAGSEAWTILEGKAGAYRAEIERVNKSVGTTTKAFEELKQIGFDNLNPGQQLASLTTDLESVKQKLHDIGIVAETPEQALLGVKNQATDQAAEVRKLALEWAKLSDQVTKTSAEQTKASAEAGNAHEKEQKEIQDEITKLEEKAAALRNIVLTVGDPKKREEAIKDLKEIEIKLGDLYKKQGEAPKPGTGLEKWLLDIIADAKATTIEVENARRALAKLYQEQGKKNVPIPNAKYIPGTNILDVPAPDGSIANRFPGTGPGSLGDRFNQPQRNLFPADASQLSDQPKQTEAVSKAATDAAASVDKITTAATDGLGKISGAITDSAGKIAPLFEPVATSIHTDIPAAVSTGLEGVVSAVNTATQNLATDFARQVSAINLRIGALERRS